MTLSGPAGGTGGTVTLQVPSIWVQGWVQDANYLAWFARLSPGQSP
jgi:hypothetical protein